jgi:predicted small secreted protein
MRKTAVLTLALAGVLLGACNTVQGVGQDVQAVGRGLEKASNDAEDSIQSERGPSGS